MNNYQLGWYGIAGAERHSTKTHIVTDGKPICGSRMRPEMEFQWCSNHPFLYEPECRRCVTVASSRGIPLKVVLTCICGARIDNR